MSASSIETTHSVLDTAVSELIVPCDSTERKEEEISLTAEEGTELEVTEKPLTSDEKETCATAVQEVVPEGATESVMESIELKAKTDTEGPSEEMPVSEVAIPCDTITEMTEEQTGEVLETDTTQKLDQTTEITRQETLAVPSEENVQTESSELLKESPVDEISGETIKPKLETSLTELNVALDVTAQQRKDQKLR
uniref:Uncharacterized protein LOC111123829 n=1 Tax=Crassostrea virginica TaxID=6565 RepID=A0A8B8D5P7_CRAVI|nr:uncharacterized protein LOC111123829 [Crassostrea virginica]